MNSNSIVDRLKEFLDGAFSKGAKEVCFSLQNSPQVRFDGLPTTDDFRTIDQQDLDVLVEAGGGVEMLDRLKQGSMMEQFTLASDQFGNLRCAAFNIPSEGRGYALVVMPPKSHK